MLTYQREQLIQILYEILKDTNLLDHILKTINMKLCPEDVFKQNNLADWAERAGYIKDEDDLEDWAKRAGFTKYHKACDKFDKLFILDALEKQLHTDSKED